MAQSQTNKPTQHSDFNSTANPRAALTARLWRAAERQAAEVEARIDMLPRAAGDAERDARVLAVLAKTLRELSAADLAQQEEEADATQETTPDDLESLRAALSDKLRQIRGGRSEQLA
jgi:hypothetical protein